MEAPNAVRDRSSADLANSGVRRWPRARLLPQVGFDAVMGQQRRARRAPSSLPPTAWAAVLTLTTGWPARASISLRVALPARGCPACCIQRSSRARTPAARRRAWSVLASTAWANPTHHPSMASARDVDQTPPDPAVAVRERMDRLELGVRDGGLQRRGEVVAVEEGAQVRQEVGDPPFGRRDERRDPRVVVVASDPVLAVTDDSGDSPRRRRLQQRVVDGDEIVDGQGASLTSQRDRVLHGGEVSEHVRGSSVALVVGGLTERGTGEALVRQRETLDP
jgi:hypothetical protein